MAGVRRLLEKDLELDEFTLDPIKKLISEQLDEVIEATQKNVFAFVEKHMLLTLVVIYSAN